MTLLKLAALDDEDLRIVSAHVQDAVLKVGDMAYMKAQKRFALALRRFAWERTSRGLFGGRHERRLSLLHFDRVLAVRSSGIDPGRRDDTLSLLAIEFEAGTAPSGTIEIAFSGGATIRLAVECIEARLRDTGAAWETTARPRHTL